MSDNDEMTPRERAVRGLEYSAEIYDKEWFEGLAWQHHWIQQLMGWLVGVLGRFESSLDLGAGHGYWSYVLSEMGADAYAVEVSKDAIAVMPEQVQCLIHDLREPLDLHRMYDLVLCIEVAEHLPEESADILCDTIARHCKYATVFTAAPPGQGGHGHINCQPPEYWINKLAARGLVHAEEWTEYARAAWKSILGDSLPWLSHNVMVFAKDNGYVE